MGSINDLFFLILIAATKFLFAPGAFKLRGYEYTEALIYTALGGFIGVIFFYYFGGWFFNGLALLVRRIRRKGEGTYHSKGKKTFTWRNRKLVGVKNSWGLLGIVILTPCILSIPIGCIIAAKYFRRNKFTVTYLLISVILWSLVLNTLFYIFDIGLA